MQMCSVFYICLLTHSMYKIHIKSKLIVVEIIMIARFIAAAGAMMNWATSLGE